MSKILVTGVAGFIGSNLAERLIADGHEVVGIDNLSYGRKEHVPAGVEFYKLDIRSKDIYPLFNGVDFVFHLAAKNCLPDCQKDPVETADINVTGAVNVFEAAHQAKVKKVIYAESSAIYEKRALGFYALSKIADNGFAKGFQEAYGMTMVGLRYFNAYGPRQDYHRAAPPIMSMFMIKLLKGQPIIIFEDDDKNGRDFIYVDDINDFHLLSIKDDRVNNKVFDIGSGVCSSIAQVHDAVSRVLGIKTEVVNKPRLPEDPVVTTQADITEAKKLGWSPKTSLDDGLRVMVEYMKSEFQKGNIV